MALIGQETSQRLERNTASYIAGQESAYMSPSSSEIAILFSVVVIHLFCCQIVQI
jgi:hypothetical protein